MSSVSVVPLGGGVNTAHVREILAKVLEESGVPAKGAPTPGQPGEGGPPKATKSSTAVMSVSPR